MDTMTRAVRRLNVRSQCSSLSPVASRFSSGFVAEIDGAYAEVNDDEVISAALRILSRRIARGSVLADLRTMREYVVMRFSCLEHEVFACVYLDTHHRVITCEELFRGTIDGAYVHPREVVKRVLIHNAAKVILVHNHPSGLAEPSDPDQNITRVLKQALSLVEVRVLDHLIVGGGGVTSMAERGML